MKRFFSSFVLFTVLVYTFSADPVYAAGKKPNTKHFRESGICSYYGGGGTTASGEPFRDYEMTAAHKSLPFGTKVKVQFKNGKSVVVRINDRGPFVPGRILDLSKGAAMKMDMIAKGIVDCTIETV